MSLEWNESMSHHRRNKSRSSSSSVLQVGDVVKVIDGMHENKVGKIESCTAKCFNIIVGTDGEMIQVLKRFTIPTTSTKMIFYPKKQVPTIGMVVRVIRGKNENAIGTILSCTPKTFHIQVMSNQTVIQVLQRLVEIVPTHKQPSTKHNKNKPSKQHYTKIKQDTSFYPHSDEKKYPVSTNHTISQNNNNIPPVIYSKKQQEQKLLYSCKSSSNHTSTDFDTAYQEENIPLEYYTTIRSVNHDSSTPSIRVTTLNPSSTPTTRSFTPSINGHATTEFCDEVTSNDSQNFFSTAKTTVKSENMEQDQELYSCISTDAIQKEDFEFFYDTYTNNDHSMDNSTRGETNFVSLAKVYATEQLFQKNKQDDMTLYWSEKQSSFNSLIGTTNNHDTNNYPMKKNVLSNYRTNVPSPRGIHYFPMYHQTAIRNNDVTSTLFDFKDDISSVTIMDLKASNGMPRRSYNDDYFQCSDFHLENDPISETEDDNDDDDVSFSTATFSTVEDQDKSHAQVSPHEFVTSNSCYEKSIPSKIVSSDDKPLSHNLEQEPREGDCIEIIGGKHAGTNGKIYSSTPKFFKILCEDGKRVLVLKDFVVLCDTSSFHKDGIYYNSTHPNFANSWKLTKDTDIGGENFGLRRIETIRLSPYYKRNDVTGSTFLDHFVGNRKLIVDLPLEKNSNIETKVMHCNNSYELISAKMVADPEDSNGSWKKVLRLFYVQVKGDDLIDVNIAKKLLSIADYVSLHPRKVNASLQLMQSPAYKFPKNKGFARFTLPAEHFCVIEEKGQEGCGFIDRDYLRKLMMHGMGKRGSERLVSIQIRAWVHSIGVLKGVLCVKKIGNGPPIQISPSMRKVGPSKITNYNSNANQAFLLVCKAGMNPTFSANYYIGRLLDSRLPDPPSSFSPKKFKPMVPRLLKGMGVPSEIVDSYVENARSAKHLKHAWVVGLADPTEDLPPNTVFITGMDKTYTGIDLDKFFITRAPAMKSTDGRVVSVIREKPELMSQKNWLFLNSLAFGSVIFANPVPGSPPLPNLISNGDLDGDLYFICWNHDIVSKVKSRPLEQVIEMMRTTKKPSYSKKVLRYTTEKDFFHCAQMLMTNWKEYQNLYLLISKLYFLSVEAADADKVNGLDNVDAICFADAYCMALEYEKHGELVYLPKRLHAHVPKFLHTFLTCMAV